MRRVLVICFVLCLLFFGTAVAQQNQTLADVLKQHDVPFPPASIPHLNSRITSYEVLDGDHQFLIAYYLDNPENRLLPPLFVTQFGRDSGKWQHVALSDMKFSGLPDAPRELRADCFGSVLKIEHHGGWYYLNLHLNPSAGCLLILNGDLSVSQTLPGWTAAFFSSGLLIWTGNTVHFADVHPETLWLYDPATQKSTQLYPQKNDPLRDAFSTRLERVINEKRCMQNNWGCNPERFSTEFRSVQVNDDTHSLALHVTFEPEGFLSREESEDNGKWDDDDYVYIFQLSPLRWRAFSIYDLQPKFGTDSLSELLTPAKLKQVFATPAP